MIFTEFLKKKIFREYDGTFDDFWEFEKISQKIEVDK